MDFVERGFQRFAKNNGANEAKTIWCGELRITDRLLELGEPDCNEMEAEAHTPPDVLYLIGEYDAAASIPVGAALLHLEREHALLPSAFYKIFVHNLWKWMRVYDYSDAVEHSELWLSELDEEDEAESCYRKVKENIPKCLAGHAILSESRARNLLREFQPSLRDSSSRQLVRHVLVLDGLGKGLEHAWASKLTKEVPEIEDMLDGTDGCGPGCLITWHENDEINACFDEEMRGIGQDGPLEPPIVLAMPLGHSSQNVDAAVKQVFDHAGAMLRSLAVAAKIVEIVREIDDEDLRQHRLKPGVQVEPRPAGVRNE